MVKQAIFDGLANEFSGERAQENTARIVEYHRIQGSPMMSAVAEQVVLKQLQAWGIESKLEHFTSDGATKYQTFISPVGWEMRGGELWVESANDEGFEPYRLCRYNDVPMCVSTYSKGGAWSGDLADVGAGVGDAGYSGKDVRGKVALAYGYAANVVREAVIKRGAVGVVIYPNPLDRPDYPDLIRYNGVWPRASELEKTSGGFQISANQYNQLKKLMQSGPVRVRGTIDATLGDGKLTLVHAYIRGSQEPNKEIVITAHLDHPKWSANDNASGSGALMELARSYSALVKAGKLPRPARTIHFMWVPEFFGTMAYVTNHPEARRCWTWDDPRKSTLPSAREPNAACVLANINMDMVGEDTVKTNSRFYFTRTPDSVPSYLDLLLEDVLAQTREAELVAPTGTRHYWGPEAINYSQGSDHDVFAGLGVPSTMLGHDPDWTHHSSEDKIDKTDATEFRRVGAFAATAAYWLAAATDAEVQRALTQTWQYYGSRFAARAIAAEHAGSPNAGPLRAKAARLLQGPSEASAYFHLEYFGATGAAIGPRRLALPPYDSSVSEQFSAEDKKWWREQQARFDSDSSGLSDFDFGLLVFETVNFMDGKRSTQQIARLVSEEFLVDVDQSWVERLVDVLARNGLVGK